MLIVKVYVNEQQIDEIQIQNIGIYDGDIYSYAVRKPRLKARILHSRPDRYYRLLHRALDLIMAERARQSHCRDEAEAERFREGEGEEWQSSDTSK